MQSITRNYLVSPFTLGISSAAALGASICIVFAAGTAMDTDLGIILSAFTLSCVCGALVYGIAQRAGLTPTTLVLVGIALNYFFSALTATLEFFAQEHKLAAVIQWTFGSLHRASWDYVVIGALIVAFGFAVAMFYCLPLNVMATSDDETAVSLGVNPARLRTIVGLAAVLMTAAIISFTGVIGFVGLIAPHMARFLIGTDHRFYLPFTCVLGAALLLVSDTVGKLILYPVTVPVGIVISFFGVPLFIHLILRRGKEFE
ncbi:iron chelate uptake ABC transporter, FeCT family, permease protein [Selenomonas sp. oral taxon 137 str. F0430]|uniref:FecCD family ABC transporter permease n=1 Tax=Selenomonas sp. oral taxon 137 TaxID=712531 RepID=UPI0001EB2CD9|nr:iron ABC transporter permease [Selenomonas sp. oral taxon 137]EFR39990.1 iron chelate uptake ABC transporter, FeCT family, permease protein [Selenomonas sp. oral taxon 137 str. F0430]